jgi:hypothetical protein
MKDPWKAGALVGSAVGLIASTAIMYIAWDHNAQGEIHNEDGVSWGYWLLIGFSWFVPVSAFLSLVVGGLFALVSRVRSGAA